MSTFCPVRHLEPSWYVGAFSLCMQGGILAVNRRCEALFGRERQELLSLSIYDLLSSEYHKRFQEIFSNCQDNRRIHVADYVDFQHANGYSFSGALELWLESHHETPCIFGVVLYLMNEETAKIAVLQQEIAAIHASHGHPTATAGPVVVNIQTGAPIVKIDDIGNDGDVSINAVGYGQEESSKCSDCEEDPVDNS